MASAGLYLRSDSLASSKPVGAFVRSDSISVKNGMWCNTRRALLCAMVLCTCAVILTQHVWYAHELVTGVGLAQFSSEPRTVENLEGVSPLSMLEEHLQSLDKAFVNNDVNTHTPSSGLGLSDEGPTLENVEEMKDGVQIGEDLVPVDWKRAAAANATKSTKRNAGDVAEEGGKVRNKQAAEEVGQKEVASAPAVELKQDYRNATVVERGEREEVSNFAAVELKEGSDVTKVERGATEVIPRAIPRTWAPPKKCATAEEMGAATVGDTRTASLRLRAMIQRWIANHGAERVRRLAAEEFCKKSFVLGQSSEEGFGNNMYKVLTAAGVAVMLNRSLILAERTGMRPKWEIHPKQTPKRAFGDYLQFSNETFTVREVRKLWAIHGCETTYNRSLIVKTESLDAAFRQTRCVCDDWTTLTVPVIEFKGATGAGATQLLLKNAHSSMRSAAVTLLGNPAVPDSRPNTFGELFRAFISPNAEIQAAVEWALNGGPAPDITLHLRMLHSKSQPGPAAASECINRIQQQISLKNPTRERRPRVAVVTDTPSIVPGLKEALGDGVEVVEFNYLEYAKGNTREDSVLRLENDLPAPERVRDWGEMPRWVAVVDFFLAARARTAVVSGAFRRVSTTYAQLVAALAAAYSLDEHDPPRRLACVYYSSFQPPLLAAGLQLQSGWGFSWRPFGGTLGCHNQTTQCAETALLPYTWWDAPWQSPIHDDVALLHAMAGLDAAGQVSETAMDQYCAAARVSENATVSLVIPSYEQAMAAA